MTRPPLMILCHGSGDSWRARVLKVGTAGGKWRRPEEGDGREATAQTARDSVLKAITLYGKGPRVCRRCGRTWECKRSRAITICPQCQTRKAAAKAADLVILMDECGQPPAEEETHSARIP